MGDLRTEEKFTKKGCGTYSFLFKDMFHCFIHLLEFGDRCQVLSRLVV